MLRSLAASLVLQMIPVMIWGNWNHVKIIQTIPEQHRGKHDITELQKTVTLSAAHKLRKLLTWKCKSFNVGK